MNVPIFRVVPLPAECGRQTRELFNSGSVPLDKYFKENVTQDTRNNLAKCYVAMSGDRIAGFYTLSASNIDLRDLSEDRQKRLRYRQIPSVRIGRLAVDLEFQMKGLGGELLADALTRIMDGPIGVYALEVDAKDETAKGFYLHHGFIPLESRAYTLYLPVADAMVSRAESE